MTPTAASRSVRLLCAVALACAVAPVARAEDGTPAPSGYHGFRIEPAALAATLAADHPTLAAQVAIVEAVDVPPDVLAFFRTVPIRLVDALPRPPGAFVDGPNGGFVRILPDGLARDQPILLHELLHAYHADVIGLDRPDITEAWTRGRQSTAFPARFRSAHFLENAREWFAVTSTIYLFGPIRQPPYDCAVLKATDPAYLAFLATRFGPHECR